MPDTSKKNNHPSKVDTKCTLTVCLRLTTQSTTITANTLATVSDQHEFSPDNVNIKSREKII